MSRRFTVTTKWDDPWFRSLPAAEKLAFLYIIDRCDPAGLWEVDPEAMQFHTRISEGEIRELLEGLANPSGTLTKGLAKGLVARSGWVWVKNFLRHQKNAELNPTVAPHRQIIELILAQSERFNDCPDFAKWVTLCKGLPNPSGIGKGIGKGKKEGDEGEKTSKARGTQQEIRDYCATIGVSSDDADWFFDKCVGSGWRNDGKPIADWKSTLRAWRGIRILPSQKNGKLHLAGDRKGRAT